MLPYYTLGNIELLKPYKTAFLCSRKCPADKVLIFFIALLIILFTLPSFAQDYTFDLSEIGKKPNNL